MAVAATLTILKQGKHYSFQWQQNLEGLPPVTFQQSRRADPAVESRIDHAVTLLNELLAQRQQRAAQASAATASDPDPLQTLGRLLYQQLFPAPIQQAILQLPPGSTLTIATNASTVPWEVAHGREWLSRADPCRQPTPAQHGLSTVASAAAGGTVGPRS
ncbi:MAG: hypothetical protein R2867_16570 [Caldilineaceae bacterium]